MFTQLLVNLAKLVVCSLVFFIGIMLGGMLVALLKLAAPAMPDGVDRSQALLSILLTVPLLALGLVLLARGLAGSFVARAAALSFLGWIAYTVNSQLETTIISPSMSGFWFSVIDFLPAWLLCGAVVAWLFPSARPAQSLAQVCQSFFSRRQAWDWVWRLTVASVIFMPIYYSFGLLVLPFVRDYYIQHLAGFTMPTLDQLLPILFMRSILFLLACLPVIVLWQESERHLFWKLGMALYLFVGALTAFAGWLPLSMRVPHSLEILADEFFYAGALVLLLASRSTIKNIMPGVIRGK